MSSTNRGMERIEFDFYATPAWCTEAIADRIDWSKVHTICEPCEGDGAIVNVIREIKKDLQWVTYEIRKGSDYLVSQPFQVGLTLTNPPFETALEFLKKSVSHSQCVVYLTRLNFLGSIERKDFLSANPPTHQYILTKRPSFVDICKGLPKTKTREKVKGCGKSFAKSDRVDKCPSCGCPVGPGTDSIEYAWFAWDWFGIMKDKPGFYWL